MKEQWKFPYKVSLLAAAAKEKRKFYESRVRYWTGKKAETIKKIKSEGIEIAESVAADDKSYLPNSFGRGGGVSVRNDLVADLQECQGKIITHNKNVAIYDGWVEVLGDQSGEHVLELTQEDWLFFFSKKR